MRLLIDSNVIIPLEDSSAALQPHLARLNLLASTHGHQLLVHPASRTDISRDTNVERRDITISRLARYPFLDAPPQHSTTTSIGDLDNDGVDRELLYALERDAVSILVSEDRGIHRKAIDLGVGARVLYIQQAVSWLERLHSIREIGFPNIRDVPLHSFTLSDPFFDSLRLGYPEFDQWFRTSAQNGRRAWAYLPDSGPPKAICIYKREENPTVTDTGLQLPGSVLKLCTFKVGEEVRGRRIGELFFKAAFKFCWDNGLEHTYLTMRPDQLYLKDLCSKYGFEDRGECSHGREIAMVKSLPRTPPSSQLAPIDYHVKFSPCIKVQPDTQVLLIPIQPQYHNLLFPEIGSQFELFSDPVIGNGLTLAYLCHARLRDIRPGDVALFYRSEDLRSITTIGVVEHSFVSSDADVIVRNAAKRTVFAYPAIQQMTNRPVRVILFRLASHLAANLPYETLLRRNIVTGPIQSIRRIPTNALQEIAQITGLQSCLFANQT